MLAVTYYKQSANISKHNEIQLDYYTKRHAIKIQLKELLTAGNRARAKSGGVGLNHSENKYLIANILTVTAIAV